MDISKFPNTLKYLSPYKNKLSEKRETKKGILPWWCLHWPRNEELYNGEKIVLRQTGDKLIAAYDPNSYYVMDSVMVLKIKSGLNILYNYLLAFLNSKLSQFLYNKIAQEQGRVFAQVKPQNIKQLYIKKINIKDQQLFVKIVDQITSEKKMNKFFDSTAFEKQIDEMIYELYSLTPEEIKIIES